ncbi:phage tail protein [Spartinivicinus poritis]|uniref:Phage tail protein n=1 Tax=Spartinivicinus poritis TaxID=2994640 RepID=A0ABT5UF60_9GAMM|nr:phage tail protein [Spartinivicinus sp. A2-2]MDE1465022.1 phage tail protein [Spartinivicinus sp. A2-2]
MALVSKTDVQNLYPLPTYRFKVDFHPAPGARAPLAAVASAEMVFQEVSGLDVGNEKITYKDGLGVKHMPGPASDVTVTLKRGLVKQDGLLLYNWFADCHVNCIDKSDITITLLGCSPEGTREVTLEDASSFVEMIQWRVLNAFPTKVTGPTFSGGSTEVAIETLEFAADDIKIAFVG